MNIETKKYEGCWWFPDNPDKKVAGSLSVNQREGIEVKIIGSLLPQQAPFSNQTEFDYKEILLGQTVDGMYITLIKVTCTNSHTPLNSNSDDHDLSTYTYSASVAIVGKRHFLSESEVFFSSAIVRFSLLDEWLCTSVFTTKDECNDDFTKFNLEYEYPEDLEFSIDSIEAGFKTQYIFNRNPKRSNLQWQLDHKTFLRLTPTKPQTFDWYSNKFESLRKFLIVMAGFPVSTRETVGYGDEFPIYSDSSFTSPIKDKEKFQVYKRLSNGLLDTTTKHHSELLINLSHLGIELSTVLNTWFQKSEVLDPAVNLYVATLLSGAENSCIAYPARFWDIKIYGFSQRKYWVSGHLKLDKVAQTHFSRADKFAKMV